jgi:hypothetical protein
MGGGLKNFKSAWLPLYYKTLRYRIPAQAGIQRFYQDVFRFCSALRNIFYLLDSRLRGNDEFQFS